MNKLLRLSNGRINTDYTVIAFCYGEDLNWLEYITDESFKQDIKNQDGKPTMMFHDSLVHARQGKWFPGKGTYLPIKKGDYFGIIRYLQHGGHERIIKLSEADYNGQSDFFQIAHDDLQELERKCSLLNSNWVFREVQDSHKILALDEFLQELVKYVKQSDIGPKSKPKPIEETGANMDYAMNQIRTSIFYRDSDKAKESCVQLAALALIMHYKLNNKL